MYFGWHAKTKFKFYFEPQSCKTVRKLLRCKMGNLIKPIVFARYHFNSMHQKLAWFFQRLKRWCDRFQRTILWLMFSFTKTRLLVNLINGHCLKKYLYTSSMLATMWFVMNATERHCETFLLQIAIAGPIQIKPHVCILDPSKEKP